MKVLAFAFVFPTLWSAMYGSQQLRLDAFPSGKKQAGAALLVILLLLISAASFLFVKNMNRGIGFRSEDGMATANALGQAKAALIGWAVLHPISPGTLLFPDRNNDGNYDGQSDCTSGVVGTNLLLGKLPWYGQTNPCVLPQTGLLLQDVRDGSGEQIWYSVSKNLVYDTSYPLINSNTANAASDWITIRDANGSILSDRVAFVIFSPWSPLPGQNRAGVAPSAGNFLDSVDVGGTTYSNEDFDQDFIQYPSSDQTADPNDNFNDVLVYVTIDELIKAVGNRVLGEARQVLGGYYGPPSSYNYYPLAAPLGSSAPNQIGQSAPAPLRRGFLPLDGPAPGEQPLTAFPPWFRTNQWDNHIYYTLAPACTLANPSCSGSGFLNAGGVGNV